MVVNNKLTNKTKKVSKKFVMKELQGILLNLERACRKAERVSAKLDLPSLGELTLIKTQIEQLIELGNSEGETK